ncbi:MAG TPA: class I SAM-dependent methyltransferase [Clostridia bacterium]|nr:class I SAM-dependent methyltransferase [Clostridia bacterium]
MVDYHYDKRLGIDTLGFREWEDEPDYYRTESTPYIALLELARFFPLEKERKVIDFGCGHGRVSFFFHDLFGLDVTGIELQEETYQELKENEVNYLQKKEIASSPFNFICTHVEDYKLRDEDVFYFFNPFSQKVFKKVLANIEKSLEVRDRECFIILYYPFVDYMYYLEKYSSFERVLRVPLSWEKDEREVFLIYRHLPWRD